MSQSPLKHVFGKKKETRDQIRVSTKQFESPVQNEKKTSKITSYFMVDKSKSNTKNSSTKIKTETQSPVNQKEQTILDLGQDSLKPILCPICGMLYYKYNAEDVKSHKSFCSMFTEGVQCPSFKNTSILTVFEDLPSSTLILAIPSETHYSCMTSLYQIMYRDVGFIVDSNEAPYYYVYTQNKRIIGYLQLKFLLSTENQGSYKPFIDFLWILKSKKSSTLEQEFITKIREFLRVSELSFSNP